MKGDYLIILHGIALSSLSMRTFEIFFKDEGYEVINFDYPSTKYSIEEIADKFLHQVIAENCSDKNKKIHFLTHSMGGIVVRYYLSNHKPENLGKVVMLAPPNQENKAAENAKKSLIWRRLLGTSLEQLSPGEKNIHKKLPPPDYELGIISGTKDLEVPLSEAEIPNVPFLAVESNHVSVMFSKKVTNAAKRFIETGLF